MKDGIFITIEGPEGSGKSTIVKMIEEYLNKEGVDYISTREPGGIHISEEIRKVILNKENTSMDGRTEALLYAAARRQHLVEKVIPALNNKKVVICDRFIDSSLAYQGYARGIGMKEVMDINKFAIGKYMPNLTLYLDIEPSLGLARISKNKNREVNRLDLENLDFHKRVREGYFKILEQYPNRVKRIDASKSIDEVFNDVKIFLNSVLMC